MYFFDTSFLSNFLSIELIWNTGKWFYKVVKGDPLNSSQGNQVFIWGSNRFIGCPNVLVIGNKPTIRVETLGNRPAKAEDVANIEVAADDEIIRAAAEIFNSDTIN